MWALLLTLFSMSLMIHRPVPASEQVFTVGVVPQFNARRIWAIWEPLLSEIEQQTGIRLELRGSPSITQFERDLRAGKFDFAYMNPYHMLKAHQAQAYQPLVRDHGRQLHGILVVRKDSPIRELADLQGQVVAFPAPDALGASLMMRAELQGREKLDIRPRYVKSHTSVYLNVVTGAAAAGGGVQKTFSQQAKGIRDQLRILHRTGKVAPHPLAAHPRVPEAIVKQVQQVMLSLGETEDGRQLVAKIPMKQIGQAHLADYSALQKMGLEPYYVKD